MEPCDSGTSAEESGDEDSGAMSPPSRSATGRLTSCWPRSRCEWDRRVRLVLGGPWAGLHDIRANAYISSCSREMRSRAQVLWQHLRVNEVSEGQTGEIRRWLDGNGFQLREAQPQQWFRDETDVRKLSFPAGILNFESSCGVCDG